MKRRKSQAPEGTFWVADERYRPCFKIGGVESPCATVAFYKVLELMCPETPINELSDAARRSVTDIIPRLAEFYPRGMDAKLRVGTKQQQDLLNSLFYWVQAALDKAHANGVKKGRELLVQLARGEITFQQLDPGKPRG